MITEYIYIYMYYPSEPFYIESMNKGLIPPTMTRWGKVTPTFHSEAIIVRPQAIGVGSIQSYVAF